MSVRVVSSLLLLAALLAAVSPPTPVSGGLLVNRAREKMRSIPSRIFKNRNKKNNGGGSSTSNGWVARKGGRIQNSDDNGPGPVVYAGGPVLVGTPNVNVYLIYYGNWPANYGQNIIENFVKSLSSTSKKQGGTGQSSVKNWFATAANYYMTKSDSGDELYVGSRVKLAGTAYDRFSMGNGPLSPSDLTKIIKYQVGAGKALPYDPLGIYFVLTSNIVEVDGFCSDYCGFHSYMKAAEGPLYWGFVGDHGGCPDGCMFEGASPNMNTAMDAGVATLGAELVDAVTNPDLSTGWMLKDGSEISDNCLGNFGNETTGEVKFERNKDGFKYRYNMVGNHGMRFLIPQLWDRISNKCMLQNDLPEEVDKSKCPLLPKVARKHVCNILKRCC